ncbi:MAG: hypothetical protein ACRD3R_13655, partial [Terriglobales bacterium]
MLMANKIAGVRSVAVFVAACEVLTVSDLILQRTRAWASENRPSDEVLAVIGKSFPAYSVIGAENIDEHSCGAVQKRPGLVVADFNGDGREDYAVLVKSEVKEAREWQGQKLKLVEVKLVALIQGAMKTLEAIVLETF